MTWWIGVVGSEMIADWWSMRAGFGGRTVGRRGRWRGLVALAVTRQFTSQLRDLQDEPRRGPAIHVLKSAIGRIP